MPITPKKKVFNGEGKELGKKVEISLKKYFKELDGEKPCGVYQMVLNEIEEPLLKVIMDKCNGNQSHASEILGINRGTLRTKLKEYNLL